MSVNKNRSDASGAGDERRPNSPDRRAFLNQARSLTAATLAASVIGLEPMAGSKSTEVLAGDGIFLTPESRRDQAYSIRQKAAAAERRLPLPLQLPNGDEFLPGRIGSFAKGLPHNALGEADPAAYNALLNACTTGRNFDFEAVPLGGANKLVNPHAGLGYQLEGADSHHLSIAIPPAFSSAWEASEMAEVYWQALTRDVPFTNYSTDALIAQASSDLSRFSDFRGPKIGGAVTPGTLFRGETPGDLAGPYISQFLCKD